jgi:hypothetical protein
MLIMLLKKLVKIFSIVFVLCFFLSGCGGGGSTNPGTGPDTTPGIDTTLTWTTVFSDDFNRADGPLGANYTVNIGGGVATFTIVSNKAVYDTPSDNHGGEAKYINNVNDTNIRASVKFTTGSNLNIETIGIIARFTAGSSDGTGYFLVGDQNGFYIYRFDDTVDEQLGANTSITLKTNTTYILEFAIVGSTLIGYLKDSGGTILLKITVTDSTYSTGKVVFGAEGTDATTIAFDDFKIETN